MNAAQKKRVSELADQHSAIMDEIEQIKNDEEEKYDNLPEPFQDGEQGERIQEGIDTLDDAYSYMYDACDSLRKVCE